MKTDDLILEIQSLPVEERVRVADCILRSLNQTVSEVDQKWANLAARRLQDIQTSAVKPVAGDDVFSHAASAAATARPPCPVVEKPQVG